MNAFNFEGGEIEEIPKFVGEGELKDESSESLQEAEKEKKFKIPYSLEASFKKNEDGTIDIETEKGALKRVSKDILPEDLQKEKQGKLLITFTDHSEISKKVLNQLLKGDQNG